MKRLQFRVWALVTFAIFIAMPLLATAADQDQRPVYAAGELLVKFKPGASEARIQKLLDHVNAQTLRKYRLQPLFHIRIPEGALARARAWLANQTEVAYTELNYYRYFDATPDDTFYNEMWGLENTGQTGGTSDADIDASQAWDITTGDSGLVVAVIDSGIDMDHEDLAGNLWTNNGEIPGNGIDDDGNGYVDDVHGWDFSGNDNDPSDDVQVCDGHGTHTSGTIGAMGDNGTGITGINWNVQIMPLKTAKSIWGIYCGLEDADIIESIEYATANGAHVSNNSYGGSSYSQATFDAINVASHLFVAAAGNDSNSNDIFPSYPASYNIERIISVAATDHNDDLAYFSNYGYQTVDLGAPGVSILSTLPHNNYDTYSGTSMASPHVAGVAALLLAADPSLTHRELKYRIMQSADFIDIPTITGGRLNANEALNLPAPVVTVEVTPTSATTVNPGDTITYDVTLTNNSTSSQSVAASVIAFQPNGGAWTLENRSLIIEAGQVLSHGFSEVVPLGAVSGAYTLSGRAEVAGVSFDEDPQTYTIP